MPAILRPAALLRAILALLCAGSLTACSGLDDAQQRALSGGAIGAVGGGVIAAVVGGPVLVGATAGAVGGAVVGYVTH